MTNLKNEFKSKIECEQDNYWFERTLDLHNYIKILKQACRDYAQNAREQQCLVQALNHQVDRFKQQIKVLEKKIEVDDPAYIMNSLNKGV